MAKIKIQLEVEDLQISEDTGVSDFKFSVDAEYSTEEIVAYMNALPECITKLLMNLDDIKKL